MVRIEQLDREVGLAVAVDVALDDLAIRRKNGPELPRIAAERHIGAYEIERLVAGQRRVGVHFIKADKVRSILEIRDHVAGGCGHAAVLDRTKTEKVLGGATGQNVLTRSADQGVSARSADQRVIATKAEQPV